MRSLRRIVSISAMLHTIVAWADYADVPANSSYLSNTKYVGNQSPITFIDPGKQLQLAQQYEAMVKAYETKQNYGILTYSDQINYNNSASAFTQGVLNEVKNYQQSTQSNKLIAALKKNPDIMAAEQAAKYPAIIVGGTLSVYRGTSYTIYKTDLLSITPGESIKDKNASLAVACPILNASVAANTDSITTNVNRGLIYHVSVNFTNTTPLQAANPPVNTVSFNYGISL